MKKPADLRAALTAAVPWLKTNPDKLHLFIDEGRIVATGQPALSFEYHYKLNLVVCDFPEHPDVVVVPTLAWFQQNQPDLLFNDERRRDGFTFEADILNNQTVDLSIDLRLTEAVRVTEQDGKLVAEHRAEPTLAPDGNLVQPDGTVFDPNVRSFLGLE